MVVVMIMMMMMRAGISGRIWGGALRTSVSTKSTNSTPLLCLTSPTTPYSSAFYHLLHCLLPSTHYRLSASRCCIHEYDNMGVNHDKRSGYFRPLQLHSPQKLLIMMLIWLCFDLDHVSYNVDLIKCMFTNKIKISFSPFCLTHSKAFQCVENSFGCISEDRGNA